MALNRRQLLAYRDTCTVIRPSVNKNTGGHGEVGNVTYTVVATGVAYMHQSTDNLDEDESDVARIDRPLLDTADRVRFDASQDVRGGDLIRCTTSGSRLNGRVFRILGTDRTEARHGRRNVNVSTYRCRQDQKPPTGLP